LHQIFDASNNNSALVDSVLEGADGGNMTQLAAAILTVLIAAWLLWRHPGAFANVKYRFLIALGGFGDRGRCGGGGRSWPIRAVSAMVRDGPRRRQPFDRHRDPAPPES
jgi:hypothetical protein